MKRRFNTAFLRLTLLILFLHAVVPARAALFYTITTNGPATNRINLVLFSEGYTSGQLGTFLNDATNAAHFFLSAQPYAEYSNYFNVFAIFTNSAHAGSTHLISTAYTTGYTYFNSCYDGNSDYLITIPPDPSFDNTLSHGQGKINALLQSYLPSTNNDLPALLVNDITEGGSDGGSSDYGKTAISYTGFSLGDIFLHESGHTLGNLGDEYTAAYPGFSTNDVEPNTTTNTILSQIKWNDWLSTNTPIPTPFLGTYASTVGLFQGAHYHLTGWYRPYENCCMNSLGSVFCPICKETLVLAIYGKVRPIENHSPSTNSLTVTSAQMLNFSLNLLKPATHNLNVQWRTNNIAIAGATNATFSIWPSLLGNGTNKVQAEVWDATAMVRTDVKNVLKQTNLWILAMAVPTMQIDLVRWQTNGSFSFRVSGSSPDGVVIQVSTNLTSWTPAETPAQTNYFAAGKFSYTNTGATGNAKQFFRAVTPP